MKIFNKKQLKRRGYVFLFISVIFFLVIAFGHSLNMLIMPFLLAAPVSLFLAVIFLASSVVSEE